MCLPSQNFAIVSEDLKKNFEKISFMGTNAMSRSWALKGPKYKSFSLMILVILGAKYILFNTKVFFISHLPF